MAARSARTSPLFPSLGLLSALVGFGGVLAAMALAPWFSLSDHALSLLGHRDAGTAPVFNAALLLGGAFGAGFVAAVSTLVEHPIRKAALVVLFLATAFMALVGVFPLPDPLHAFAAIPFFAFLTLGIALWGAGDYAAGRTARGLLFVVAALAHVAAWSFWATLDWFPPGIAIPELVGSLGLVIWTVWLSVDVFTGAIPERPAGDGAL